jgi:HEAT repeat protein
MHCWCSKPKSPAFPGRVQKRRPESAHGQTTNEDPTSYGGAGMRQACWYLILCVILAGAAYAQTPKDVRNTAKLGSRAVPQLAEYLTSADVTVRVEAVKALTEIGGTVILDPLVKATHDNDPEVQIRATDGLVNFYLPGYVKTGMASKISRVGTTIKSHFTDTNDQFIDSYIRVRPEIITALGQLVRGGSSMDSRANAARAVGILRGQAAVPDLLTSLRSKDSGLMYESLVALEKIRDPEAGPRIQFVLRDLDERVQLAAIQTTGVLTNREAIPDLIRLFNETRSAKVKRAALSALAMMPSGESRPIFLQYLRDKDARTRGAAAEGLGRLRNTADSGTIDAAYKDEDKTSPRLSQAFALVMEGQAHLSEFSPLQYLVNTLNSASYAGEAFPLLVEAARFPEIRSLLYQPMESGTRDEKIYLARVLAVSGDAQSVPYLQKLSQDPDAQVAGEGLKALRELRARLG